MPYAERDGDRVRITTTYLDRHLIGQLPGGRWDPQSKTWHAPLGWSTCVILRGLFGDELVLGERLTEWGWQMRRHIDQSMFIRDLLQLPNDHLVHSLIDKIEVDQ